MIRRASNPELVLAVYPSTKGFGYAVFEGAIMLVDWGVKGARGKGKNAVSLGKFRELLDFYRPDVLAIDDCKGERWRRARRIKALSDQMAAEAGQSGIASASISRADVRAFFSRSSARTKRQIALAIARQFPELEPRLPPVRRIWMSEDARMNIFDAVALALTFFHKKHRTRRAA